MSSTLDEICKFYSGTGFPNKFQGKTNGKYPFIKVGDISRTVKKGNITLTKSQNYINNDVVNKINGKIVPKDTIIFAKIGEALKLNRRVITNKECLIDNNILGIKPKTNKIDLKYLFYFMNHLKLEKFSESTTVPSVRQTRLKSITINIPSIDEQLEIVNILENINKAVLLKRKQLSKLDILIKARFVEMFGDPISNKKSWKKRLLNDLVDKIGSGATPKGGKESYQDHGISFIRSMNVHDGYFNYKDLAYINSTQAKQLSNVIVQSQDVFINITGASVARSCIVPDDILPARVNQHVSIIRCKSDVLNPIFINSLFLNDSFKRILLSIGLSGGATRQAITKKQLEMLKIILPPLSLQNEFANFVQQVDKSKVAVQKSLDETQKLYDSLMQEYFG